MDKGDHPQISTGRQRGSTGGSRHCAPAGFIPAFLNQSSGEIRLSVLADGRVAGVHMISCLPGHWLTHHGQGRPTRSLARGIVAGFARNGRFYSRRQAFGQL